MQIGIRVTLAAAILSSCYAASAQEYAYEKMMGLPIPSGIRPSGPAPSSIPVLAYGPDAQATFPPEISNRGRTNLGRTTRPGVTTAYCVRTCDGRYFPASFTASGNKSEACDSLCPASEMQVFTGSSIDSAYSFAGKPYSALANALRYRTELVDGCTCNGKDKVGLAKIKVEDDKTLRRGDMIVTADGLQVIRKVVGGEPQFAEAPKSVQARFDRPARVTSARIE